MPWRGRGTAVVVWSRTPPRRSKVILVPATVHRDLQTLGHHNRHPLRDVDSTSAIPQTKLPFRRRIARPKLRQKSFQFIPLFVVLLGSLRVSVPCAAWRAWACLVLGGAMAVPAACRRAE